MDRLFAIVDGAVTVFGILLMMVLVGVFAGAAVFLVVNAPPLVGVVAMAPVAALLLVCAFCIREWYRSL